MAMHVVYDRSPFELIHEVIVIRHTPNDAVERFSTRSVYLQGSWQVTPRLRPYFRYQYLDAPAGDPVFADVGHLSGPSLGLRREATDAVALKAQFDRVDQVGDGLVHSLTLQASFTF